MSKKTIYGLILIGLVVIVLIANTRGSKVDVNLVWTEFEAIKSLAFLGFAAIGVVIGVLLK